MHAGSAIYVSPDTNRKFALAHQCGDAPHPPACAPGREYAARALGMRVLADVVTNAETGLERACRIIAATVTGRAESSSSVGRRACVHVLVCVCVSVCGPSRLPSDGGRPPDVFILIETVFIFMALQEIKREKKPQTLHVFMSHFITKPTFHAVRCRYSFKKHCFLSP